MRPLLVRAGGPPRSVRSYAGCSTGNFYQIVKDQKQTRGSPAIRLPPRGIHHSNGTVRRVNTSPAKFFPPPEPPARSIPPATASSSSSRERYSIGRFAVRLGAKWKFFGSRENARKHCGTTANFGTGDHAESRACGQRASGSAKRRNRCGTSK